MSLYSDYFKELWGCETLEKEGGFATYLFDGAECLIDDLYVDPKYRRQRLCYQMADEISAIAKQHGCRFLTCKTNKGARGWEDRVRVFLGYGFKEFKNEDGKMYFVKELR